MNNVIVAMIIATSLVISASTNAAILTFADSTADIDVTTLVNPFTANTTPFLAGSEIRWIAPNGYLTGGFPEHKNTMYGGETWAYCNTCGTMTGTSGINDTPGVNPDITDTYPGQSADPSGGPAMDEGYPFFGMSFGFLAPYVGSDAANAYGVATFNHSSGNIWDFFFPVLELQWAGVFFPLGGRPYNISDPPYSGVSLTMEVLNDSGEFILYGEHLIKPWEDHFETGLSGYTVQWMYSGTVTQLPSNIPIPATAWLFCSGLIGLYGMAKRKKIA